MSTDYTVRLYREGDEKGIVELLNHAFNGWPKLNVDPLSHWRWKYVDSPHWRNDVSVAVHGDRVIGCKHSVYQRLKIGDEDLLSTLGSDLAVHRDYRGMGVSNELSSSSTREKVKIGYEYSYFVTSNPMLIQSYRSRHISFPHEVVVYVLIKDIEKQTDTMPIKQPHLKMLAYRGAAAANRVSRALSKKARPFKGVVRRVESFDERLDALWDKASPQFEVAVRRDAQYLNWRYADPRAGEHVAWVAEEDGEVAGYCVVCVNRYLRDYPVAYLMDLFCLQGRDGVASALLDEATRFFHEGDCNIITALAIEGSRLEATLSRSGFLNSREKLNLFFGRHGLRANDEAIMKTIGSCASSAFHFSYGDIDSLPVEYSGKAHR